MASSDRSFASNSNRNVERTVSYAPTMQKFILSLALNLVPQKLESVAIANAYELMAFFSFSKRKR